MNRSPSTFASTSAASFRLSVGQPERPEVDIWPVRIHHGPMPRARRDCRWCSRPIQLGHPTLKFIFGWLVALAMGSAGFAATLDLHITPQVLGADLQPASLRYTSAGGETFSFTRVSYLVSEISLQRVDGTWLVASNSVGWFDAEQGRNTLRLPGVPMGEYLSLRFNVGLPNAMNRANITNYPAGHPLNPLVNNLYWSWQGGFIFLALEGLWRNSAGELDGWAYHFARDSNCTPVTLAVSLVITNETRVELAFDVGQLLNAPRPLSFQRDGSSTHSRDGDPVSAALAGNLPGAFRVLRVSGLSAAEVAQAHPQPLYLPAHATPYALTISPLFPLPDLPRDNPLLVERVELGRKLFFDSTLSDNGQQSCATCHRPARSFSEPRAVSAGAEGQTGTRNAMTLENLAWKSAYFWDGRAATLREQVLQPIQNPLEMHNTLTNLVRQLARATNGYAADFTRAFGTPEITPEKIALALENYLLTLTAFDAKFDRVLRGEAAFTSQEQRGFELFSTEYDPRRGQFGADCFHCHGGPLFQSQNFANNGLDDHFTDLGRAKVTGRASDLGKFSVPSLRNVAVTGPYMHDGRFRTLEEVVEHYVSGVKRSPTLDPNLAKHPDGGVPLTAADQQALVAFLCTLTEMNEAGTD